MAKSAAAPEHPVVQPQDKPQEKPVTQAKSPLHKEAATTLSSPPDSTYKKTFSKPTSQADVKHTDKTASQKPNTNSVHLDSSKSLAELAKPGGQIVDKTHGKQSGQVIDKANRSSDKAESRQSSDTKTKPQINVELRDLSSAKPNKSDFLVKSDGTIEMYSDPELAKVKSINIVVDRADGQLNPSAKQKASSEELVRYLAERLKKQFPSDSTSGITLNDKDGIASGATRKMHDLVPPSDLQKVTPQTRQSIEETNRFNGLRGIDLPKTSTDSIGSFNTREVPRQAGESEQKAWTKEAWAGLFRPDSNNAYQTVRQSPQGDDRVGRYGISGAQLLSFLDSLGDPPNRALIEELIKQGKLDMKFGKSLEDPEFVERFKKLAEKMQSGASLDQDDTNLLSKEAQESIAGILVDQTRARLGDNPGVVAAALTSGKAPADLQQSDLQSPEMQQMASAGEKLYEIAAKRSDSSHVDLNPGERVISPDKREPLIREALRLAGVEATEANIKAVDAIVRRESDWDTKSINDWDINAKNGDPSRGLMQTIGATFKEYAKPGYDKDIYDPLSNMVAGIRYAMSRYGSLPLVASRSNY